MTRKAEPVSQERQLALLVSSAVDYAIFMLDVDGHVLTWNAGAERMKGYQPEEIIGRHFSAFYTEHDVARGHPEEELRRAITHGRYEEEGWRVRKDGTRFWGNIVITPIYDDSGELIGFGKVSRDLTGRRIGEERTRARTRELESANDQLLEYRRLVSSVREYAIFMIDPAGHVLTWNTGAQHLKGYQPEEVIGRHFSIFYTAEDRARDHPSHVLTTATREGRFEEMGWRVRKDGSAFWANVTITPVRDDAGEVTGFAKVTRDLTARKEAEDALHRALGELRVVNEELDRFAAVAAHDLADPLHTISGFAEILAHENLPPAEAQRFAGYIHASSTRLSEMLQGLLAYARAGTTQRSVEPIRLAEVVEQVLADLTASIEQRGTEVTTGVPASATVLANAGDLRLVVQNLISNAVKFADPEHPGVKVDAEHAEGGSWRLVIEDNGSGIEEEDRERIFKAFERAAGTERAGYGLGLAISQRLVHRLGGRIGVESEVGRGSSFWFVLPAGDGSAGLPAST